MKRFIIITAIFIGISIPVWIVYEAITLPSKFKLLLPRDSDSQIGRDISIVIQIDEKEDFYLNNQKTSFHILFNQIDSLGSVGYNDSTLILVADKQVMVETIVKVMNYAHETNRQIILKSN